MKTSKFLFLVTALAVVSLATPGWTQMSGRGGEIAPNGGPRSGLFIPDLPIGPSGHPYVDYEMSISLPGIYRIECVSSNARTFDPYLQLFLNGQQVATNDNGGGNLNARIRTPLVPGRYTVRVSTLRRGVIPMPTPFTLRVVSQTVPGGIPTPPIPNVLPNIPIPQL